MKAQKKVHNDSWRWFAIVFIGIAVILGLTAKSFGAENHYIEVLVDSNQGDSARFYIIDNTTGDSVTTGTMTEAARLGGTETVWKGNFSTTLYRPITIIGRVYDSVTVMARFSYEVDLSGKVAIDSLNLIIDSLYAIIDTLQNYDNWIATAAILANVRDTVNVALDTLQNQDNWILRPTTAGRTLDVNATGGASIDWAQIDNPTTTVGLSGTTVGTTTALTGKTGFALTDAQLALIADTVWQADTASSNNVAGSFGAVQTSALRSTVGNRTLDVTSTGAAGVDWANVENQGTTVDLAATTLFAVDVATTAGAISTNGISAGSFATDAISAGALSTAAVDEIWEYDSASVGTATSLGQTLKRTYSSQKDSTLQAIRDGSSGKNNFKATGFSTHSAADVWSSATRALTDKADFSLSNANIAVIVDSIYQADTASNNAVAASYGALLATPAYVQGAASGLTAGAVADAVWDELTTGHAVTGSFAGIVTDSLDAKVSTAGSVATIGDADMAAIADTLKNRGDTVFNTAFWHTLALHADSGTSTSEWSTTEVDSILNAIRDGSLGKNNFKATGFSSHTVDDIWSYAIRTLSSERWSSTEKDSILNAIRDGASGKNNFKASVSDIYNYFVSGSNEDQFKADVSGVSTFDASTDSVMIQDRGQIAAQVADSVLVDSSSYQGAGSSLTAADIWNTAFGTAFTAGSMGDSLTNSSYVQGSASGLSASEILDSIRAIAPADTGTGTVLAQIVRLLDTTVSSAGGNDGDYLLTLVVLDTSGTDTVLENAKVTFNNLAQTGVGDDELSDENGIIYKNLANGNYAVSFRKGGYGDITDTVVISSASKSDTLKVYNATTPGTPVTFSLRTIAPGQYASAIVKVNLVAVNDSNVFVGDSLISAANSWSLIDTTDSNGDLTVYLWSNAVLSGDSTYYQVIATNSTGRKNLIQYTNFHVPDSSAVVNFSDLTAWKP